MLKLNKQEILRFNMSVASVDIRFERNIFWESISAVNEMEKNRVDVWRIRVSENDPLNDYLYSVLDKTEQERSNRFYKEKDKKTFIVSHAAVRILLGKYLHRAPTAIRLMEQSPAKKPVLCDNAVHPLHFNISHSGDWVLIAVANYEVGIDIELVNSSFVYNELAVSSLKNDEIKFLRQSGEQEKIFYLFWTRKEALLKGTGKGLVDDLFAIPCLDGIHSVSGAIIGSSDSWQIRSFGMDDGYMASVAFNPSIRNIRYLNCKLENA
jgi:4'-phosphopantetheinyl transferase